MKKLLFLILILRSLMSFAQQTITKQVVTPSGDTVFVTAITTPSTLNYATLNQSTIALTNGGLPVTISPATLNQATMTQGATTLSVIVHPKIVVQSAVVSTPVYTPSGPITLQSGKTYSGLVIDLANAATIGMLGNGVSNIHITNCKIINTTSFAIQLNGCSNVTIDNCFISNVGFGVYSQGTNSGIKVNNNQFLNINGINTSSLGHAVQFNGTSGGGNQINNNRIENIAGVALHPHDMINLFQCNGLQGDSIQVIGNMIRGGQITLWPDQNHGAAGIIMGDVSGSYQVCRNNILINPGYSGIQCNGTGTKIKIDHNLIFSTQTAINANAITILDANANQIEVSYNQTNWTNHNGINALLSDGETQYFLGNNPVSPTPINFNTNTWKANISTSILPATIITFK